MQVYTVVILTRDGEVGSLVSYWGEGAGDLAGKDFLDARAELGDDATVLLFCSQESGVGGGRFEPVRQNA